MYDESAAKCVCCGVSASFHPLHGPTERAMCSMCLLPCGGLHRGERYTQLVNLHRTGRMWWSDVVARAAIEDAWLVGKMDIDAHGSITIPVAVKRWEVLIAWHRTASYTIDLKALVDTILLPYLGRKNLATTREDIKLEIDTAITMLDPRFRGSTVKLEGEDVRTDGIVIEIMMNEPEPPLTTTMTTGVDIPDDILARKRAEA